MMSDSTSRFELPFILPGQAQKELFHNEALVEIDAALHAAVEGAPAASPPASPVEGQCWIVAEGAGGAWAGQAGSLAAWTAGGWRFVPPVEGMAAWDKAAGVERRYRGGAWSSGQIFGSAVVIGGQQVVGPRRPVVPSPSGGTIIDAEARTAVDAVIATLMSHGLIG
jgi:hypothetical protein